MKHIFIFTLGLLISTISYAVVDCRGTPSSAKVGEYGNQEGFLIVDIAGTDYRLGPGNDDYAKARFAVANTALVSGKDLLLKFYGSSSCTDASSNHTIPNTKVVEA
ncbi:MAG: hypothetical protein JKY67_11810 [Pseudomonadales bacterium]|nr:hypothetical protein [Pseudomonadales bacterium]